jgi:hypothetical protein
LIAPRPSPEGYEKPDELAEALAAQSARLKQPPISVAGILDLLAPTTPKFVAAWRSLHP